jgi:hypothetical protein
MVIPLLALAVLAFVVIRSLMGVVAHDDTAPSATHAYATDPGAASAPWGDDARAFLLPAADTERVGEHLDVNAG